MSINFHRNRVIFIEHKLFIWGNSLIIFGRSVGTLLEFQFLKTVWILWHHARFHDLPKHQWFTADKNGQTAGISTVSVISSALITSFLMPAGVYTGMLHSRSGCWIASTFALFYVCYISVQNCWPCGGHIMYKVNTLTADWHTDTWLPDHFYKFV